MANRLANTVTATSSGAGVESENTVHAAISSMNGAVRVISEAPRRSGAKATEKLSK